MAGISSSTSIESGSMTLSLPSLHVTTIKLPSCNHPTSSAGLDNLAKRIRRPIVGCHSRTVWSKPIDASAGGPGQSPGRTARPVTDLVWFESERRSLPVAGSQSRMLSSTPPEANPYSPGKKANARTLRECPSMTRSGAS